MKADRDDTGNSVNRVAVPHPARRRPILRPSIGLASRLGQPYMGLVALLFESGPYFVSLQASNPVPYPIAEVRLATHVVWWKYVNGAVNVSRYS